MAKWRAIYGKVSTSGQVLRMSEFAQHLFILMTVHADDWGVISGDPLEVKAQTMPGSSRNLQDFTDAIKEMKEQGLAWCYEPDGYGPLVQLITFDDHQPKSLLGKRTAPKDPLHHLHPNYPDFPDLSWNSVEKPGTASLDKSRQDKSRNTTTTPFSQIFTEVTDVLVATGVQAEEMDAWMEDVSEQWFRDACKEAVDNNAAKWSYVRAILKRWKKEGRKKRGKHSRGSRGSDPHGHDAAARARAKRREAEAGAIP